MNIDITPGLADQYQTSGLCGNFDGDRYNDGVLKDHFGLPQIKLLVEDSLKNHWYMFCFYLFNCECII